MKKLIGLAAFVVALQAQATGLHPDTYARFAKMTEWQMTEANPLRPDAIYGGRVVLNKFTQKIRLDLQVTPSCPEGAYCYVGPIFKTITEASIVKQSTDDCGVVTYTAIHDELPVDGNKVTVTLQDTSLSRCDQAYAAPTIIEHELQYWNRMGGFMVEHHSQFMADVLQLRGDF